MARTAHATGKPLRTSRSSRRRSIGNRGPTSSWVGADGVANQHPSRPCRPARAKAGAPRPRIEPVRRGLVASIRGEIRAGTYDVDGRIPGAIERLLADLNFAQP